MFREFIEYSSNSVPMSWSTRFDEPIRLDDKALHSLRDAGEHVIALPPKETKQAHWQTAMSCLLAAAERKRPGGDGTHCHDESTRNGKATPSERLLAALGPDTLHVEGMQCTPAVSGSPAGNVRVQSCNPPSNGRPVRVRSGRREAD